MDNIFLIYVIEELGNKVLFIMYFFYNGKGDVSDLILVVKREIIICLLFFLFCYVDF